MNPRQALETLGHYTAARWRWTHLHGARLERFQDARARALLPWVQARGAFYRDLWAGHDLRDWRNLPGVDKRAMMANFAHFNTAGVGLQAAMEVALRAERERDFRPIVRGARGERLTVGLSSGTSGHRGVFLVSQGEQNAWAGVILARALHRPLWLGERIAFFLRANSNLYERVGGGRLQFRYFDLMTPPETAVQHLETWQPSVLVAPGSLLRLLAAHTPRIAPHTVIAVAEVLEPQDRALLERAFGVPVHSIYQATEGLIAASCAHGRLHLQEDLMHVQLEPVPGDPSGARHTPVLTDLWRRTQPIVRYRLNDIVHVDPRACPCGNPWRVLSQVEGRSDDTLRFFAADGTARVVFPDVIRRAVLLSSPAVLEYAAVQREDNTLHVMLEVEAQNQERALDTVRAGLERELLAYTIGRPRLEVTLGVPRGAPSVKLRRVRRERSLE